jgi:hypothetical protein
VDVRLGVHLAGRQLAGGGPVGVGRFAAADGLGEVEHERCRRHRDVAGPGGRHHAVGQRDDGAEAAHGVVAVPAGHLDERRPAARREHGERHGLGQLAVGQGGLERAGEEVGRGDVAAAASAGHVHRSAGEREDGGHLAARVGVRDAADRGAAVADDRVRHQPQRVPQQRLHGVRRLVPLDRRVPGKRAHAHGTVRDPDVGQLGQPVDVDEVRRGGQPHVEQRQQALAAR